MVELYKGQPGSPITYLASDISATQTTISVSDDSALPDAPNICTIGYGENIETIKYGVKSNGVLQEVVRGIEGTPQQWAKGTEVARFFTAYDHNNIVQNMLVANDFESVGELGSKASTLIQNNEDIKLDIDNMAYKDLEGITRLLGWGIIVESGENENGSYVKYGDGTMMCYGRVVLDENDGSGKVFSFSASFIDSNYVVFVTANGVASSAASGSYVVEQTRVDSSRFKAKALVHTATSVNVPASVISLYYAIGKWK